MCDTVKPRKTPNSEGVVSKRRYTNCRSDIEINGNSRVSYQVTFDVLLDRVIQMTEIRLSI